jgi:hypothetical protein
MLSQKQHNYVYDTLIVPEDAVVMATIGLDYKVIHGIKFIKAVERCPLFFRNTRPTHSIWSRGSSVSIVSDYGLDNQASIPGRGRGFFF